MENMINAKVVYKDLSDNNKIVYSRNISGPVNSPLHPNYYRQCTPSGYHFEGYGHFDRYLKNHGVNVIYVKKHATTSASSKDNSQQSKGTVMVDYINANNQLVSHKTFTGAVGQEFNVDKCKSVTPEGYKFKHFLTGSNIDSFKSSSQIIVAQVEKIQYVKIVLKFMFKNHQVSRISLRNPVGTPFDINHYLKQIPYGYKFTKLDDKAPKTFDHDHIIKVEVNEVVSHAQTSQSSDVKEPQSSQAEKSVNSVNDPKKIGSILMKLASSLHDLGLAISKDRKL